MSKYINLFNSHTDYNNHINSETFNASSPNIAFCKSETNVKDKHLHYGDKEKYRRMYFTTIARENGTISFNIWKSMGTDLITSISYSTDDGATWTTTQNQDNKSEHLSITVNVGEGDKVLWKGNAQQTGYDDEDDGDFVGSFFSSTAEFDAQGNVMSLLYGDNFEDETTLEYEGQFCYLFSDWNINPNTRLNCKIVNANNLVLPATTLTDDCYRDMFVSCTSLIKAPELPATTLANSCYFKMFDDCTSLVKAPKLPATTLGNYCYNVIFRNCTSLTNAPELPATTLKNGCYYGMFTNCTSLTKAPELPATTLANSCYNGMFHSCTSLKKTPELPATTLADYCYNAMFYGCTSLTKASELPAIIMQAGCYYSMFENCISLTRAPALPAPSLSSPINAIYCYKEMFKGCSKLNYIKALFTNSAAAPWTIDWVKGVAKRGIFIKNSAATWNTEGTSEIPNGWTVYTETVS